MTRAGGHDFHGERMTKLRPIAAVLFVLACTAPFCTASAEPLERDECDVLKAQQKDLLTASVSAALQRGPDWVKEHLHDKDTIEQIREYLIVEEKVAFRCRTDGVRIPKPEPPSLPDRKPPVPTFIVAGVEATSLFPLRNPSRKAGDAIAAALAADGTEGEGDIDGDAVLSPDSEPAAPQAAIPPAAADDAAGASQDVADSDKTAPSDNKATQ